MPNCSDRSYSWAWRVRKSDHQRLSNPTKLKHEMKKVWAMNSILFCVPRVCVLGLYWKCVLDVHWKAIFDLLQKDVLGVCVWDFDWKYVSDFVREIVFRPQWQFDGPEVCAFPLCIFSLFGVEPGQHVRSFPTQGWCEYKEAIGRRLITRPPRQIL